MKNKIGVTLFKISIFFLLAAALASFAMAASANYGQGAYGSGIYGNADPSSSATDDSSSGSSSSSGGGEGLTTPVPPVGPSAHFWSSVEAGSTLNMKIIREDIAVKQIEVLINKPLKNVEISVAKLLSEPPTEKAGIIVYQYLDIKKINIKDDELSKATIRFEVAKSWIADNNVLPEDVILKHYKNGRWEDLPTAVIKENSEDLLNDSISSNVIIYESTTDSFSYFSISVNQKALGAGALPAGICSESWECTEWGNCEGGIQKRACTDKNLCNITTSKPEESKDCSKLAEEDTPKYESTKKEGTSFGKIVLWILILAGIAGAGIGGYYIYQNHPEYVLWSTKEKSQPASTLPQEDMAKLNSYIMNCLSKGFNAEIIEKKLISAGWQKDIIDKQILEIMRKKH